MKLWRMKEPCENCPFNAKGPGLHLRKSLRPGRWAEILRGLRRDESFNCHKTTAETGDGSELLCAGAIAWQEKHNGQPPQMARWMERIEAIYAKK